MRTSLSDIRQLVHHFPSPDDQGKIFVHTAIVQHYGDSAEDIARVAGWLASWRGREGLSIQHPRVALFAGSYAHSNDQGDVRDKVQDIVDGKTLLTPLCQTVDIDLRLYELDIATPAAPLTPGPAMIEEECSKAIAYGMVAVEAGIDLLCIDAIGNGYRESIDLLCAELSKPNVDALDVLCHFGGYDVAAMVGAIIAARMGRVPVIAASPASLLAVCIAGSITPHAVSHVAVVPTTIDIEVQSLPCLSLDTAMWAPFLNKTLAPADKAVMMIPWLKSIIAAYTQIK